ncbi:unnamed protein product [Gadus morhua 'NCC']
MEADRPGAAPRPLTHTAGSSSRLSHLGEDPTPLIPIKHTSTQGRTDRMGRKPRNHKGGPTAESAVVCGAPEPPGGFVRSARPGLLQVHSHAPLPVTRLLKAESLQSCQHHITPSLSPPSPNTPSPSPPFPNTHSTIPFAFPSC